MIQTSTLSGLYSQLAGVLAGFAFVGLAGVLFRPDPVDTLGRDGVSRAHERSFSRRGAPSLFSSFVALVTCSVLFSLLAGDEQQSARAAAGLLLYGPAFGLAILSLLYTLALQAVGRPDLRTIVTSGRLMVVLVGPVIVLSRLTIAAHDIGARDNQDRAMPWLRLEDAFNPTWVLTGLIIVVGLATVTGVIRIPTNNPHAAPTVVVVVTVSTALLSPFLSVQDAEWVLPPMLVVVGLSTGFIALALFSVLAGSALTDRTPAADSTATPPESIGGAVGTDTTNASQPARAAGADGRDFRLLVNITTGVVLASAAVAAHSLIAGSDTNSPPVLRALLWAAALTATILTYISTLFGSRLATTDHDPVDTALLILVAISESLLFSLTAIDSEHLVRYWFVVLAAFGTVAAFTVTRIWMRLHPGATAIGRDSVIYRRSLVRDITMATATAVASVVIAVCQPAGVAAIMVATGALVGLLVANVQQQWTRRAFVSAFASGKVATDA